MKTGIVVGSYRNSPWLEKCLNSLPEDIDIMVSRNGGYELGAIRWALENTGLEEFLFLPDSCQAKRTEWLYEILAAHGTSISLCNEPCWGGSYLVKYRRDTLMKCVIPIIKSKNDAVIYESIFNHEYQMKEERKMILWPQLGCGEWRFDEMFGRKIVRMENEHFVKYKNCWSTSMVDMCEKRDISTRFANP